MTLPTPRPHGRTIPPRLPRKLRRRLLLAAALTLLALPAPAEEDRRPGLCEAAARDAAAETGVPLPVLRAVMLTETGRKRDGEMRPWPWTVNAGGKGVWFQTADDARAYAYQRLEAGEESFDVGCFQVNYKWHGARFASLEEMFNPRLNAAYAARFLATLRERHGGWDAAVGAYHNADPERAQAYLARYSRYLRTLRSEEEPQFATTTATAETEPEATPAPPPDAPRLNTYPLLVEGHASPRLGSLVPVAPTAGGASLFAPAHGLSRGL